MKTFFYFGFILCASLLLLNSCATPQLDSELSVMTFNIRYNNPNDGVNAWPNRKALAAGAILERDIDIIGMQEVLKSQLDDLDSLLFDYDWCGVGRDDGKSAGEFTPIFFLRDRFENMGDSTLWLSETPTAPSSKSWDTACTRIVTYVRLRDKTCDREFYVFNTHFDHISELARIRSARLLLNLMKAVAGEKPIILTGDFNCTAQDSAYKILTGVLPDDVVLKDSRTISAMPHAGIKNTFNGFTDPGGTQEIDFIFVNPRVKVMTHETLNILKDGVYISDHYPVVSEVVF
ncbi:MAG: endonuclease/exonuclease/phosphatase family protein [Candidatus Zhuqueibacterota bacterium]